jgi:hypothetical protein
MPQQQGFTRFVGKAPLSATTDFVAADARLERAIGPAAASILPEFACR